MIPVSLAIVLIIIAGVMAFAAIVVAGEKRVYGAVSAVCAAILSWYLALSIISGNIGSVELSIAETVIEDGGNLTRTIYQEIPIVITDPGLAALFTGAAVICTLLAGILVIMAGIDIFQEVDE